MPKMATKAANNVFYKARIAAASWNDRLGSREGASEVTSDTFSQALTTASSRKSSRLSSTSVVWTRACMSYCVSTLM